MFTGFSIYLRPKLFVVNIDFMLVHNVHSDIRILF